MGKGNKNLRGDGEEGGEDGGGERRVQNSPKAFGELIIYLYTTTTVNAKYSQNSACSFEKNC